MTLVPYLGGINACFNALSALLLVAGFTFIKRGRRDLHRIAMLSAFASSTLFLAGYLTRAALHGTRAFPGTGWIKTLYLAILIPHMILAVLVVPLVLTTLTLALRGRFPQHRRLARITFPIWMYVSVTGVIVYLMLYRLPVA
jgi:putative membrane protein